MISTSSSTSSSSSSQSHMIHTTLICEPATKETLLRTLSVHEAYIYIIFRPGRRCQARYLHSVTHVSLPTIFPRSILCFRFSSGKLHIFCSLRAWCTHYHKGESHAACHLRDNYRTNTTAVGRDYSSKTNL